MSMPEPIVQLASSFAGIGLSAQAMRKQRQAANLDTSRISAFLRFGALSQGQCKFDACRSVGEFTFLFEHVRCCAEPTSQNVLVHAYPKRVNRECVNRTTCEKPAIPVEQPNSEEHSKNTPRALQDHSRSTKPSSFQDRSKCTLGPLEELHDEAPTASQKRWTVLHFATAALTAPRNEVPSQERNVHGTAARAPSRKTTSLHFTRSMRTEPICHTAAKS